MLHLGQYQIAVRALRQKDSLPHRNSCKMQRPERCPCPSSHPLSTHTVARHSESCHVINFLRIWIWIRVRAWVSVWVPLQLSLSLSFSLSADSQLSRKKNKQSFTHTHTLAHTLTHTPWYVDTLLVCFVTFSPTPPRFSFTFAQSQQKMFLLSTISYFPFPIFHFVF